MQVRSFVKNISQNIWTHLFIYYSSPYYG